MMTIIASGRPSDVLLSSELMRLLNARLSVGPEIVSRLEVNRISASHRAQPLAVERG
jgi:hypothetical protein